MFKDRGTKPCEANSEHGADGSKVWNKSSVYFSFVVPVVYWHRKWLEIGQWTYHWFHQPLVQFENFIFLQLNTGAHAAGTEHHQHCISVIYFAQCIIVMLTINKWKHDRNYMIQNSGPASMLSSTLVSLSLWAGVTWQRRGWEKRLVYHLSSVELVKPYARTEEGYAREDWSCGQTVEAKVPQQMDMKRNSPPESVVMVWLIKDLSITVIKYLVCVCIYTNFHCPGAKMLQLVLGISSIHPFIYYKVKGVEFLQFCAALSLRFISEILIYVTSPGLQILDKWKTISRDSQLHTVWVCVRFPTTCHRHISKLCLGLCLLEKWWIFPR